MSGRFAAFLGIAHSAMKTDMKQRIVETCNECGRSVAYGSGHFVNRVPDLNDVETRKEMGKPFPEGGFICAECDEQMNREDV